MIESHVNCINKKNMNFYRLLKIFFLVTYTMFLLLSNIFSSPKTEVGEGVLIIDGTGFKRKGNTLSWDFYHKGNALEKHSFYTLFKYKKKYNQYQ